SAGIPQARANGLSTNDDRADTPTRLPATRHRSRHYGARSKTPLIPAHSASKTRVNALMAGKPGQKPGPPHRGPPPRAAPGGPPRGGRGGGGLARHEGATHGDGR